MNALRTYGRLMLGARRQVVALLALTTLTSLTEGFGILLLVPLLGLLDASGNHGRNEVVQHLQDALNSAGLPITAGGLLAAFIALVALRSVGQYAREEVGFRLQHGLVDQLRLRCFAALLRVEWRWMVNARRADHANLLLTDVSRVGVGLHFGLSLLASTATAGACISAAIVLSPKLTLIALASGALVFGMLARQRRQALRLGLSLTVSNRSLHGNVQESLAGIKLAKILGTESLHLGQFKTITDELRAQQSAFSQASSQSRALFQFGGAALLTAYLYAGLRIWHTPVGELLTLVLVFSRLIPLFMAGHQQLHYCLHALPALEQINTLLADCKVHAEPPASKDRGPWPVEREVCLQEVTVRYPSREQPALHDLTAHFPARTTTAIMGASGAGKSTLADVLAGLLAPDSGVLTIDGVPVTDTARLAWRQHVAYVPQEVFLFHDTIRQNLGWGQPDADEASMRLALHRAAADFVDALPQGLDTVVGDGGVRLSGGERQRIALARALLRKPSMLILDEATSALDTDNETRIRQAIERLHGDLTLIIIGHRLPTLEHADQVLVLAAGRVSAQGTWDEIARRRKSSVS